MATDYYRLRIQGLNQTEYVECVTHWEGTNLTAADYIPNAQDLIASWVDALAAAWLTLLPQSYQLLRLSAMKASPGGGAEVVANYQFNSNQGVVGSNSPANQLCPMIMLIPPMGIKTAGRMYMPAIAESQIAANVVNSTWLTNVDAMMSSAIAGFSFSTITWKQAVYSRKNSSFALVQDYSVSPVVGWQRKRQRAPL